MKHLIFFDRHCNLCLKSVRFILNIDKNERFLFAPLDGKTAKEKLPSKVQSANTLILLERRDKKQKRIWAYGRAVCRILWLIGGKWKALGVFCFLPFGVDAVYRWVAHHRRKISLKKPTFSKKEKKRFLP